MGGTATTPGGNRQSQRLQPYSLAGVGRNPYAYKAWFLATESRSLRGAGRRLRLQSAAGALASDHVGNQALGSASRLQRIWERVARLQDFAGRPAEGVARLAQR